MNAGEEGRECVSLVHGFFAHSVMLGPLAHRLADLGYRAERFGYRDMRRSILVHAERFADALRRLDAAPDVATIHLVTHSMGGIVARAALAGFRPRKLGRFVMLAPPNRGSYVANWLAGPFGRLFEPVAELTTRTDSLVNTLSMPEGVEVGVIAAGKDALVAPASTRPSVPHAFALLPCMHSSLLFRRDAADLVARFLTTGTFEPMSGARQATRRPPAPDGRPRR
jgi:pimeloyl-ACP methyl ester carboxylesterase